MKQRWALAVNRYQTVIVSTDKALPLDYPCPSIVDQERLAARHPLKAHSNA